MNIGKCASFTVIILGLVSSGCSSGHSIHSKAVRDLIKYQGQKIQKAKSRDGSNFKAWTTERIKTLKSAVSSLDLSMENINKEEAIHALKFSSNQNLKSKVGSDAHSIGYLIGKIYLEKQTGLGNAIKNQFKEDYHALNELAEKIKKSWKNLEEHHIKISEFAQKSIISSIDPQFIEVISKEIPGAPEDIKKVLKRSQKVNENLKRIMGSGLINNGPIGKVSSTLENAIEILEKIK